MIKFEDHYLIPGMKQYKENGYSVITGGLFIQGYEIQYPDGEIRTVSCLSKVEKILEEARARDCKVLGDS